MMVLKNAVFGVGALALALGAQAVVADATFNIKGSNDMDSTIQVKNGIGKMTTPGQEDYVVFNSKTGTMIHVDPVRGTFMEMTEAQINAQLEQAAAIKEQMAPHMDAVRAGIAGLDENTRKMIEERMGGMGGAPAAGASKPQAPIEVTKKGSSKIAGLKCEDHQFTQAGKPVGNACLMTSANGEVSNEDFATLQATMDFLHKMTKKAGGMMDSVGGSGIMAAADVRGVPLSVDDKMGGDSFKVESVSDAKLSENLFTDYQKLQRKEMPNFGTR